MKKNSYFLLAVISILAVGCSGQNAQGSDDKTSVEATVAEVKAQPTNIMTAEGIGPLKIGMPMSEIPASVDGLYDKFDQKRADEFGDDCLAFYELKFYKKGRVVLEGTADDGECTQKFQIASLYAVEDTLVKVSIDGVQYSCNDDIASLISGQTIQQKSSDVFDKDVYLYQGVEIGLTNHLHIKRGTTIRRLEVANRNLITPIPEDFVP
ncbi:MAG: hypothetical protein AUK63_1552 [bacterium P3]|nr:MAG: hypothetical protein AUK63_1552 [bacterium P3]KWW41052.1 MAG: hypothetical protein F083_1219 [bacterium F083]